MTLICPIADVIDPRETLITPETERPSDTHETFIPTAEHVIARRECLTATREPLTATPESVTPTCEPSDSHSRIARSHVAISHSHRTSPNPRCLFGAERAMHAARQLEQCTLEEVHSLPDDGYKYELVRAQLFVTPALIAERGLVWHSFGAAEPLKIVVSELFA